MHRTFMQLGLTLFFISSQLSASETTTAPAVTMLSPTTIAQQEPSLLATNRAMDAIGEWNGKLKAVISINPHAISDARQLDTLRAAGTLHSPLHGAPILIKDNIETRELPTTAGSLALAGNKTGRDATLVKNLRAAGLVIVGKSNLSEWANFRSERSSSGWSAVGGQARNPYNRLRSPCGSSSGSAVAIAAGIVPLAIGTETNGSIICPAAVNGIVGIKPTLGLVSRRGIVPIAHSQDTAGPMALNVTDAAHLLNAMVSFDPDDEASQAARAFFERDYPGSLKATGLQGKRIGVVRSLAGFHDAVDRHFDQAVQDLAASGATIVDNLEYPHHPENFGMAAYNVLLYEFKHDLNQYLSGLPGEAGQLTLEKLIAFNQQNAKSEMFWFGQDVFLQAQEKGDLNSAEYQDALSQVRSFSQAAINDLLTAHDLDLLVSPSNTPAWSIDVIVGDHYLGGSSSMPARAGYPHITVPMGQVHGLPVGLSFVGTAFAEPVLIEAAYAYEQATQHAKPPFGYVPWRPVVAAQTNNNVPDRDHPPD